LTGLDYSVLQIKTKKVSCHTAVSKTGGQWYSDTSPFSIPCQNSNLAGNVDQSPNGESSTESHNESTSSTDTSSIFNDTSTESSAQTRTASATFAETPTGRFGTGTIPSAIRSTRLFDQFSATQPCNDVAGSSTGFDQSWIDVGAKMFDGVDQRIDSVSVI
jgi:hypothetical protein